MATTLTSAFVGNLSVPEKKASIATRFFDWCTAQEHNRFLWLALALTGHGAVLTPLTLLAVVLAGTNLVLFMAAMVTMGMALVSNLAALPTKYTVPIFFFSVLMDVVIVVIALYQGLQVSNMGL